SYAELGTLIPAAGSTYSYAYCTLGEIVAWLVGWDLMLEYGLANSAVAAGWGAYLNQILGGFHVQLPAVLLNAPGTPIPGTHEVAWFNAPAAFSILFVTALLVAGIKESARLNTALVAAKCGVLLMFLAVCAPHFDTAKLHPFMPFGWTGVMAGAGSLFFVFVGFDAVTTVAEETIEPQKNVPRGVLAALGIVTLLYVGVGLVLTGVMPLSAMRDDAHPLASALVLVHQPQAAFLLSFVAVVGILSVLLVGTIGQTRILYVMARDGLLPRLFSNVHARTGAPIEATVILGVITAILAAAVPLDALADLVSLGTLIAFCVVSIGVIILRRSQPELPRTFRCPWVPVLPIASVAANLYLMASLSWRIWVCYAFWMALGLAIYFAWSRRSASRVFTPNLEAEPAPLLD
ncbi:MAG TPA: amino acid permease, partial [Oscillatoriaceae cyanobacterium]